MALLYLSLGFIGTLCSYAGEAEEETETDKTARIPPIGAGMPNNLMLFLVLA